ncbi:MAG: pyridoxal-phosphate dependent enzyme [Kangiellaceae bacterium]|nr:pyridoxal-phosphate dependent enzyme [Kangiellaceae bacterium]
MKRDDLLHPIISGNKGRKLKYLLQDAKQKSCDTLVSMGGNWSNHLHALAYAGKELGFKTIGYVRAHPEQPLTSTLDDCIQWGMQLKFFNRQDYTQLRQDNHWRSKQSSIPKSYWVAEGGFSKLAIQGVEDIAQEVDQFYDYVLTGVGSGATLLGLAKGFNQSKLIGVAAFSGAEYLTEQLTQQEPMLSNWRLDTEHHCGGFAKSNEQLKNALNAFKKYNGFAIDSLYNGKTFLALLDSIEHRKIAQGSSILLINTGGMQGERTI